MCIGVQRDLNVRRWAYAESVALIARSSADAGIAFARLLRVSGNAGMGRARFQANLG